MNESKWFEEIMLQKFSSYSQKDITKLLFVYFVSENKKIELCWNIKDLYNYIYDFYIDNNRYAKINPSSIIRNINKYGVDDIVGVVSSNLIEWKDDSKNSILQFDNCNIWLSLDSVSDNFYTMSKQVADMVFKRLTGDKYQYQHQLDELYGTDDKNLFGFGKSRFKNRLKREMQYCVLCDETDDSNLVAVHICDDCNDQCDFVDVNNGLIMCAEHAKEYISGNIYIDERGFVYTKDKTRTSMHVSQRLLTKERKEFLLKKISKA